MREFDPNLYGPQSRRMPAGLVGRISVGGPTHHIVIDGKSHYFEIHRFCGLIYTTKDGDSKKDPGPRHSFWDGVELWEAQGHQFNPDGTCRYDPDAKVVPILKHLGGTHYQVIGHETVGERRSRGR